MQFYLIRATLTFGYGGVVLRVNRQHDVPENLYESDPPPATEADGNVRHIYYWHSTSPQWDERKATNELRSLIEKQGHVVDRIEFTVLRTSGEPTPLQATHDGIAYRRKLGVDLGHDDYYPEF